jgi:hypothetical protein
MVFGFYEMIPICAYQFIQVIRWDDDQSVPPGDGIGGITEFDGAS